MPIMEISVLPLGTQNPSVTEWVKNAIGVLKGEPQIRYQITAMGTIIEADSANKLLRIAEKMHKATLKDAERIVTSIKIDDRKDKQSNMEEKTQSVAVANTEMGQDVQDWIKHHSEYFLRKIGLEEGQKVLDFGCRSGVYTLPAARIVGKRGVVYAVEKEKEQLYKVEQKASLRSLTNIKALRHLHWENEIEKKTVAIILLFDVLHPGYFPTKNDRKQLLRVFYEVLKPRGLICVLPTHVEQRKVPLKHFIAEIRDAGFHLENKQRELLVHDNKLEKGDILRFRKI